MCGPRRGPRRGSFLAARDPRPRPVAARRGRVGRGGRGGPGRGIGTGAGDLCDAVAARPPPPAPGPRRGTSVPRASARVGSGRPPGPPPRAAPASYVRYLGRRRLEMLLLPFLDLKMLKLGDGWEGLLLHSGAGVTPRGRRRLPRRLSRAPLLGPPRHSRAEGSAGGTGSPRVAARVGGAILKVGLPCRGGLRVPCRRPPVGDVFNHAPSRTTFGTALSHPRRSSCLPPDE